MRYLYTLRDDHTITDRGHRAVGKPPRFICFITGRLDPGGTDLASKRIKCEAGEGINKCESAMEKWL